MFQIDNSTAVAAIPASTPAGAAGYFTDGNPATGVSATILPAEFMNMLMMENMNVLAAAGIAPSKTQLNQLSLAIAKIVQNGAAGAASETSAGILKLATSTLSAAGTDNSTAITPQKLAAQIQAGGLAFATDTGTANTYVCNFSPAITARVEGQVLRFKVKTSNTGASTFNDGLGAVALVGGAHAALQGNELIANGDAWVQWNSSIGGGSYILLLCTGASEQVAPATQSQHAMQLGQAQARIGTAGGFSFRNKLINAAGTVNQRSYVSGTATTGANQYTVDRWKVIVSSQSLSWVANGAGVTFTAPAGGVAQVIPASYIEGGTYVLSWTGSATATVNGTSVTNGGSIAISANTQTTVVFSGGTFAFPQLEIGTVGTPFEWRQHVELSICQQFYEAGSGFMASYNAAGGSMATLVGFKATKRATPTMGTIGSGAYNCGGVGSTAVDQGGFGAFALITATGSAQTSFTWTASAEL